MKVYLTEYDVIEIFHRSSKNIANQIPVELFKIRVNKSDEFNGWILPKNWNIAFDNDINKADVLKEYLINNNININSGDWNPDSN